MKKPELLSPAGDLERLKIALLYGADAVYVGGPMLGLRANAINFSIEEIKEGCEFAHKLGKKVYVTVNIVLHNKEILHLIGYLKDLEEAKVDAVIVSDPAILKIAKEHTNLELHLSTQASTLNKEAVKFFKDYGLTRIVLGRETSKEDIESILKNVDIELEMFIHGAMCSSYSGRCVLSNFFTSRDANRGGCAQICRWNFDLLDEDKNHLKGEKEFTFCTKDLSNLKNLPNIIDLGVSSLKIEGRMRSVYYVATVVGIYRKEIDKYIADPKNYKYDLANEKALLNVANRDSVSQFFEGNFGHESQYYNGRMEVSNQDFLGMVLDYKDGVATIEQRNYFKKGDVVEFFGSKTETYEYTIDEVINDEGEIIDVVRHPKQIITLKIPKKLEKYDMMRIKKIDNLPAL